ncbi:MAG TPA: protein kinase [Streptosporangiaceae bacterium]|nr:protein kinase [Streptosporangiaceae bacterium]
MRPLEPGDPPAIGPFGVLARLGAGAMGIVFLARSAGGRPVAVKLVHPGLAADQDFRARFRREVAAARRVGGFWTAAVVDADVSAPVPWLATEYVPGPTLQEAISATGPLPEPALRVLAAGLAEALAAIHELGLVHRDVKPSNVLLAAGGPRLIDFGIVRALEHTAITAAGTVFGTPGYMAPEQAAGSEPGPSSDVYSLGAVLVFAATGAGPLGSGTPVELMSRAAAGRAAAGATPASLHGLATACLATDPRARPRPRDIIAAVAAGGLPDTSGWLPVPVQTMAETLAAAPSATSVLTAASPAGPAPGRAMSRGPDLAAGPVRPAAPGPASPLPYSPLPYSPGPCAPAPYPRSPATAPGPPGAVGSQPGMVPGPAGAAAGDPGSAVFAASRGWAALRGGLCAAVVVVAEGLSQGGPAARLLGLVLLVWALAVAAAVLAGAVSLPRRVEVGRAGVIIVRSRSQVRLPWSDVARIGVTGRRRPWLVAWPQSPAGDRLLSESFRAYHGGYRLQRVAPWRWRRARVAEASALCAALAWHGGPRFDPRLPRA